MPDLFNGDPITLNRPDDFDIMAWLNGKYNPKGHAHLPPDVDPIVEKSISIMKEKYGVKVCQSSSVRAYRTRRSVY